MTGREIRPVDVSIQKSQERIDMDRNDWIVWDAHRVSSWLKKELRSRSGMLYNLQHESIRTNWIEYLQSMIKFNEQGSFGYGKVVCRSGMLKTECTQTDKWYFFLVDRMDTKIDLGTKQESSQYIKYISSATKHCSPENFLM